MTCSRQFRLISVASLSLPFERKPAGSNQRSLASFLLKLFPYLSTSRAVQFSDTCHSHFSSKDITHKLSTGYFQSQQGTSRSSHGNSHDTCTYRFHTDNSSVPITSYSRVKCPVLGTRRAKPTSRFPGTDARAVTRGARERAQRAPLHVVSRTQTDTSGERAPEEAGAHVLTGVSAT